MKKPRKRDREVSYWESMADAVIGLLLMILLILMLLILYLMRAKEDDLIGDSMDHGDENGGYGYTADWEHADYDNNGYRGDGEYEEDHDGGGGGYPYEDPDPGMGEGDGSDKAAVLVQVIDGETERTIKKAGITFEVYNSSNALQVLSTYYPVKIDYKKYETDKSGMFYLPEKIPLGTYYLNELTEIDGYDPAENWEFAPDDDYDWDDPYLVSVKVYPSKNIVRIQLRDSVSGDALNGASFEIVAAEDIVTKDGTTRYHQGDVADTVEIVENGYAESKELYLGKYQIRQKTAPEYYSCILTDTSVEVKSKSKAATPALNELSERKTDFTVKVTDALYETKPITGASFKVTASGGTTVGTLTSDENGEIYLENLKKGVTYNVVQTSTAKNYKMDPEEHTFTVDSKGLINEKETDELLVANSIVRASFSVRDKLLGNHLSDVTMALLDDSGRVLQKWSSTAVDNVIEGLVPGEYRIILDGDENKSYPIVVDDVIEVQNFIFDKWTPADIGLIAVACLVLAGAIAVVVFVIRRRRNNRKAEE